MNTILKYLPDKSLLNKTFAYLESCHSIHAAVVDAEGRVDPVEKSNVEKLPYSRMYPVSFQEDIGGIRCSAGSEEILETAGPHIRFCVAILENILEKDLIINQTMEEMLHLSDQLHFLHTLAAKLSGVHDIEEYVVMVTREIAMSIEADAVFVHVHDATKSRQIISHNMSESDVPDIEQDPAVLALQEDKTAIVRLLDGKTAIIIPIREKNEYIGRMVLLRKAGRRTFTAYEKQFVSIINNIISPTMESISLFSSLQVQYLNTVKALAAAIDAKDAYTHGHSFRVARFSVAIGRKLDIPAAQLSSLEIAAYMHDLGKIGIPESILAKPGKLSPEEYEEIKKHPMLTNKILEPIDLPDFIVDATLQHHERMDGQGYPLGLKGESISRFARIIAVADVFDALTSARPYRGAMTVEIALTTIGDGIDTEFDRTVVLAFIDALQNYTKDRDLSVACTDLEFADIGNINRFLENLIREILASPQSSLPATGFVKSC